MTESPSYSAANPGVAVILLAGGAGLRAGLDMPKQLAMLGGKSVLAWSLDAFAAHPAIRSGVVVASADTLPYLPPLPPGWDVAAAGPERRLSVASGLEALAHVADDAIILIHDAARPGVTGGVIDNLLNCIVGGAVAAVPALPVTDTLVSRTGTTMGDVMDRASLVQVQTPQAFRISPLRLAHQSWDREQIATDDSQVVRALGHDVALIDGDARLHKLTYADDLIKLRAMLAPEGQAEMRHVTGSGYDVHRLVAGKPLWLGGVEIPHSHGLAGHSDADVALHALTDAILGALADGDIGDHFPPSDPQWRGANSSLFLSFAAERVKARGGRIDHVDMTIMAEAPRIGPHRAAIRTRLADILALSEAQVSVKATTTEGLGFTGRREGIAAQAIATLSLPFE